MQRRAIRGADLKPSTMQHVGMLNAEKCIKYLRGIGVEIDDATADSWLDTQGAFRFLRSEKASWRRVEHWSCRCGAMEGFAERGRGRKRIKRTKGEPPKQHRCEECGTGFRNMSTVFVVLLDGNCARLSAWRRRGDPASPRRVGGRSVMRPERAPVLAVD